MNNKLRLISKLAATFAVASFGLMGCADDGDGGTGDSSAETDATMTDSGTAGTAGTDGTATGGGTSAGTTAGTTTTDSTTAAPMPAADGESCMMDAECMSEQCFVVGVLGGICGECNEDADCDQWGCSIPNPLADPPQGSVCGDGQVGSGCEDDAACDGLTCAVILDVPGVFTASTCSECNEDADCTEAGTVCNPSYSVTELTGEKACVMAGSVADGEGCVIGAETTACQNSCATASVMGLLDLGVCSPCLVDADCPTMGDVCEPPEVDLAEGLIAGACVTPA